MAKSSAPHHDPLIFEASIETRPQAPTFQVVAGSDGAVAEAAVSANGTCAG